LQLLISAIVLWNTVYISRAVDALRAKGVNIPDEYLQHISPLGWEHIKKSLNLYSSLEDPISI
jgi:hypothetical protein